MANMQNINEEEDLSMCEMCGEVIKTHSKCKICRRLLEDRIDKKAESPVSKTYNLRSKVDPDYCAECSSIEKEKEHSKNVKDECADCGCFIEKSLERYLTRGNYCAPCNAKKPTKLCR